MNHEKTFAAIKKLQEVEIELHRLKNLLEIANKALGAKRTWVGLTIEEMHQLNDALNLNGRFPIIAAIEAKLKEKNSA